MLFKRLYLHYRVQTKPQTLSKMALSLITIGQTI